MRFCSKVAVIAQHSVMECTLRPLSEFEVSPKHTTFHKHFTALHHGHHDTTTIHREFDVFTRQSGYREVGGSIPSG